MSESEESKRLESLVFNVPLSITETADEINKLTEKFKSINQIDGQPVSIVSLNVTGETAVEKIGVTYLVHGKQHTRKYAPQEFYAL